MLLSSINILASLFGLALAAPTLDTRETCNAERRIFYASQVPFAYSQNEPGATYAAFSAIPFGVPNLEGPCTTTIYPNGASGVTVTSTGQGVVNFGTETRQAFSSVTGRYVDFGANGTTVIHTNVTLGVRSEAVVPVTFTAQVFLDFNNDCRISAVRAFAQVPTYILGEPTDLWRFLGVPRTPIIT